MEHCYGRYGEKREDCRKCQWSKYCKNAGDPELMVLHSPPPEANDRILNRQYGLDRVTLRREDETHRYSRTELLEVIAFMASMDYRMLKLLDEKIRDPTLNLAELAEKQSLSRQNLHKQLRLRLNRIPELEKIMTYRKRLTQSKKQTTFLEEVCQIRRKTQELRWKKQKSASNCSKSWNCLNPSLFSSPPSIIKGNAIWRNDSRC